MEEVLRELVNVIELSNQKTCWDYLIVVAPIALSLVAIVISAKIAKTQNKISLFEKRYEVYALLAFIITVGEMVIAYEGVDKKEPLKSGMRSYCLVSRPLDNFYHEINENFSSFYTNIFLELGRIQCLFSGTNVDSIIEFITTFSSYVSKVRNESPSQIEYENLKEKMITIKNNKIIEKLDRYIKL